MGLLKSGSRLRWGRRSGYGVFMADTDSKEQVGERDGDSDRALVALAFPKRTKQRTNPSDARRYRCVACGVTIRVEWPRHYRGQATATFCPVGCLLPLEAVDEGDE